MFFSIHTMVPRTLAIFYLFSLPRHASEVLLIRGDEQKAKRKREEFLKQAKEIERFIMTQAQERER